MSSYTTFRVIKIIDEYSLVINGGIDDDISLGEEIEIFLEGDEITDPFKGDKVLGTLDYIKDKLEVTEVYPDFSVCKKIERKEVYHPSALQRAFAASTELGGTKETITTIEKINVEGTQITGRKTGDKIIRIGDVARIGLNK
ncbi:hypothetical protein [Bacillus sp. MMSF_3328]|uniref:hypothetical protein n=1 Tax=Bacillus sp. MMSF_3328 TaxID=3047080 RepID=UPI00273E7139|nr:hypothetical protein [Bacillus sp. MMSF_3328]